MEERKLNTRQPKPLEELNVIDDFLFNEIMADEEKGEEVCRMIIGTVLDREVKRITFTPQRTIPGISERKHGIRLDAFIKEFHDENGKDGTDISVYDVEPDNTGEEKDSLPKRSRYYGDLIDVKLLDTGMDYDELPELVTIFILSYDPFGAGSMYYEAGTVIKTHPEIPYNDGVRRIYLYTKGKVSENAGAGEKRLKNLLMYINNSTDSNVTDEITRRLDQIVKITKEKKDFGVRYKKSGLLEKKLKEEGRQEGRQEGEWLALLRMVCRKLAKGKSVDMIADELEEDEETIKEICEVAKKYAPDYDAEAICKEFMEKMKEVEKEAYIV